MVEFGPVLMGADGTVHRSSPSPPRSGGEGVARGTSTGSSPQPPCPLHHPLTLPSPPCGGEEWLQLGHPTQNGALRGVTEGAGSSGVGQNTVGSRMPLGIWHPDSLEGKDVDDQSSAASSFSVPLLRAAATMPALPRMVASMELAMSGFWRRKVLAFSRPCPMRSPL